MKDYRRDCVGCSMVAGKTLVLHKADCILALCFHKGSHTDTLQSEELSHSTAGSNAGLITFKLES